ncbi:MAG: ImmA/IrrE family metallo-endopeptidase [Synergistaceae bacterium]|nr:ImmA/IrrE family metallo-endopeptidase [Synergistaceae bacterium]
MVVYSKGTRVSPKSRAEIEKIAWAVRNLSGYSNKTVLFPIMKFIEHSLPCIFPDFSFEVMPDDEIKPRAFSVPDNHLIVVKNSVYEGACAHVGKDRMTMAHEVGHIFLHAGVPMAKNYEQTEFKVYEDSEWQADVFAGELLAPIKLIRAMNYHEIQVECQISEKAAYAQWKASRKKLCCA